MHGIYSNPGDQIWLMMGSEGTGNSETYAEDEAHGGPFCIAFPKSADYPWDYSSDGVDKDYLAALILYARDEWPIDNNAVFLHGFSSGGIQIHNLMNTECVVEQLVAGVATYGSGNVLDPPTTKAAYLIVMSTHDNIVAYKYAWVNDKAYPSCDCNTNLGDQGGCLQGLEYYTLQGEELATSIANLRGFSGNLFDAHPTPSYTLNLIKKSNSVCQNVVNSCISPYVVDTGYTCANLPVDETQVIEYGITDNSAGPVVLWKIMLHNHDYPNKRRVSFGPTEFFFQLKLFFNANRGIKTFSGTRSITEVAQETCNTPDALTMLYDSSKPVSRFIKTMGPLPGNAGKITCGEYCLREQRCVDAFYLYSYCLIYYDIMPCTSTKGGDVVHFKASVANLPTAQPTTAPPSVTSLPNLPTLPPTNAPTASPGLCDSSQTLKATTIAGYSCAPLYQIDSTVGGTEQACTDVSGQWIPYNCTTADGHYRENGGDDWEYAQYFKGPWSSICCEDSAPNTPTSAPASATPVAQPSLSGCPSECAVPNCVWLGTDGPEWDPSWSRDDDGTPTNNGFCTNYCKVYDSESQKALCGDGAWHQSGTDCTGCQDIALNPTLPPIERGPSSGLCQATESLSGHALWGKGTFECNGGPNPTSPSVCTVYQAFNGDKTVNSGRTCEDFCTNFGLKCLNGFDDSEDGCLYGGPGIGCNSVLGCCSEGGPTPDHVCVCGENIYPITASPTSSSTVFPSASPTKFSTAPPSNFPTSSPSASPTSIPTASPTANPTSSPTAIPTASPTAPSTATPSYNPTTTPIDPTNFPTSIPTASPTANPTSSPTAIPTASPTASSTATPSYNPTATPIDPTNFPTVSPTASPTVSPTASPSRSPTSTPMASLFVFVANMDVTFKEKNGKWRPTLKLVIKDTNNKKVKGATISYVYRYKKKSISKTCSTNRKGLCKIKTKNLKSTIDTVTFELDITAPNADYNPELNFVHNDCPVFSSSCEEYVIMKPE
eukprot:CAMPEP_0194396696 /NCGR_PEP_ID=MMETSP0174-20130528/125135_1 /TAXON_ID=216777 /ORGANISM="Proboscia alata, Strain PI-D3" /LENGTH=998 /DNA_ID=CAMNT_0039192795 /DNA_START=386 /DNA_END=3382 /DNA_ORIENTATION=-